jgi:phosphopantothenoylcysteine synthetase/decarboxylase
MLQQIQNLLEHEMRIVITGGPGSEPIDRVRYITNQSTGELAVKLARRFSEGGHQVELFLGNGAIWRLQTANYFQTTDDLERLLNEIVERDRVDAVLHAAALSDFGVGETIVSGKRRRCAGSGSTDSIQPDGRLYCERVRVWSWIWFLHSEGSS